MPQHPPATQHSKLGFTSLLVVLLAFALQTVYLPAHLVFEEHQSLLGDCVRLQHDADDDWHDHGSGWHRHGLSTSDRHQHVGGVQAEDEHKHDGDHDHGCQYFVQRLQKVQIRIVEAVALPEAQLAMEWLEDFRSVEQQSAFEHWPTSAPVRVYGSRGPPARV